MCVGYDGGADRLSSDHPRDVARDAHIKHSNWHAMLSTETDRSRIHHLEVVLQDLRVAHRVVARCIRVNCWVPVVDAVDLCPFEDNLRLDLLQPLLVRRFLFLDLLELLCSRRDLQDSPATRKHFGAFVDLLFDGVIQLVVPLLEGRGVLKHFLFLFFFIFSFLF